MRKLYLWTLATVFAWTLGAGASRAVGAFPMNAAGAGAQDQDRDRDAVRPELANFDVFLDGHPEIARDLRNNPDQINNQEFLENHPQLRDYLQDHPNVREDLRENPRAFDERRAEI